MNFLTKDMFWLLQKNIHAYVCMVYDLIYLSYYVHVDIKFKHSKYILDSVFIT